MGTVMPTGGSDFRNFMDNISKLAEQKKVSGTETAETEKIEVSPEIQAQINKIFSQRMLMCIIAKDHFTALQSKQFEPTFKLSLVEDITSNDYRDAITEGRAVMVRPQTETEPPELIFQEELHNVFEEARAAGVAPTSVEVTTPAGVQRVDGFTTRKMTTLEAACLPLFLAQKTNLEKKETKLREAEGATPQRAQVAQTGGEVTTLPSQHSLNKELSKQTNYYQTKGDAIRQLRRDERQAQADAQKEAEQKHRTEQVEQQKRTQQQSGG